jgi:hypothetical protein
VSRRFLVVVAVLGVLAAGCELRADLRLELNADESGRVLVTLGLDEEFQALVESSGESIEDSMFGEDNPFGALPNAEQRTYTAGEFTYYEGSVPFSDLNGLRVLGQSDTDSPLETFDIDYTEDDVSVRASIDLGELTGGDLADDQLAGIGADAIAEIFKFHIQVSMPGKVTSHNADRVLDDGTLEWDIPFTGAQPTLNVSARSSLDDGGGVPLWLVVLLILVGLAVVVAVVVIRGRQRPSQPLEPETQAAAPVVTEVTNVDDKEG